MAESNAYLDKALECVRELLEGERRAGADLSAETRLSDVLDSFHMVQLVVILEDRLNIKFTMRDLIERADWESPAAIATTLRRVAESKAER